MADRSSTGAQAYAEPSTLVEGDLIGRMKWMNDAESWQKSGDRLIVRSRPKTDFWRKISYGHITDNGHFFHLTVKGDFIFQARVNGKSATARATPASCLPGTSRTGPR